MTAPVDDVVRVEPPEEPREGAPPPANHDVFVSYSTRDKLVADALVSRLEQAKIRCWVAPRDVVPGMVWAEAIIEAIATSRLMVVVLSGAANESPQVLREVERAVASGAVVIPFRIESVEPTGAMAYYLAGEHWLDAMTPPMETHIAQLVGVAQMLLDRAPVEARPVPMPAPATAGSGGRRSLLIPGLVAGGVLVVAGIAAAAFIGAGGVPDASASPSATVEPSAEPTVVVTPTPSEVPTAAPTPTPAPSTDGTGVETTVFDLEVGYCFSLIGDQFATVNVVDCGQSHVYEVFALVDHDGGPADPWPGGDAMAEDADLACRARFDAYVGIDYESSIYWISTLTPSPDTWADGDREIVCSLMLGADGEVTSGSAMGSGE